MTHNHDGIIELTEVDKPDRQLERAYQGYAAAMQALDTATDDEAKQSALAALRTADKQIQALKDKDRPASWDWRIAR